jgi:hypothetical protein
MALSVVPMPVKLAMPYVARHHRHNRPPTGGLFAAGVSDGGELVGVAIAGRPVARVLDDGCTVEITRCCVLDGAPRNACSMLYGAVCRAAKALGYTRAVTYTLAEEDGASVAAAGFVKVADLPSRPYCTVGAKRRRQVIKTLFGDVQARPPGPKTRWERRL